MDFICRNDAIFFFTYSILTTVLGLLQFGYNSEVINIAEKNIENSMRDIYKDRFSQHISEDYTQNLYFTVSIFVCGGLLGCLSSNWMANRFGRRGGLLLNTMLGILGACLIYFAKVSHSFEMLSIGRFIIGINFGLYSLLAPMNILGGLGTVPHLVLTLVLLFTQIVKVLVGLGNPGLKIALDVLAFLLFSVLLAM